LYQFYSFRLNRSKEELSKYMHMDAKNLVNSKKQKTGNTMPEITLTVNHKAGLHARPAATFVQTCNRYKSNIRVKHGDKDVNAKSILSVLTLGANQGAVITISAEGEDAEQALSDLTKLIDGNFGEGG